MHPRPDPDLLDAWRAGDQTAGQALFRRHYESIVRFFDNSVDTNDVADLVQSTFIACTNGRERFEGRSSFRTYLFGIANNVLRSYYRSRSTRGPELDFQVTSVADLGLGQSTLLERKRERRVLLEALRSIPLDSQVLLQLRFWEELRTHELALVLGVPRGTAVDRLRRAQEQLRQAIARINASPDVLESTMANVDDWAAKVGRADEHDSQLSALLPERLDRCRLVAREHAAGCERASYRGGNTQLELELRRLGPDDPGTVERPPEWTGVSVLGRPAWLRWDADAHAVEVRLRAGGVVVTLRQRPASCADATLELAGLLALDSIEKIGSSEQSVGSCLVVDGKRSSDTPFVEMAPAHARERT